MPRIHSIETFGTHEWPGIRLVVFLQGCRFRCLYCHNPDTWGESDGRDISIEAILALLDRSAPYLRDGGITFSGGEPLLQRTVLIPLFRCIRKAGYHIALDTNGSFLDDDTRTLLSMTDLVLLDCKHIDPESHRRITGHDNATPLAFAEYMSQENIPFWVRYVLVPWYTDNSEDIERMGRRLATFSSLQRLEILPYHRMGVHKYTELGIPYPLTDVRPMNIAEIHTVVDVFRRYVPETYVR